MGALATPRAMDQQFIPVAEQFEYWVPKADTSLAMGRLTLRGEDRQWVQTQRVVSNNQALTTLSWGGPVDVALCARLRLHGRLDDMANGRFGSWQIRKGVQTRFDPVQYRYTDQFSPISENSANLLICNYFFLLQPSLSFAPLTHTQHLTQRLKIPRRKACRFDSGPGTTDKAQHVVRGYGGFCPQ